MIPCIAWGVMWGQYSIDLCMHSFDRCLVLQICCCTLVILHACMHMPLLGVLPAKSQTSVNTNSSE